ncbi:fungal specific transcription factor [Paraphaeosphaeria sporulosa]
MSSPQIGIDRLPTRRVSNEPREAMNCKSCRKRKIKCNRTRPTCEACQVFNCPCIYDAVPKKRGPKADVPEAMRRRQCASRVTSQSRLKRVNGLEKRQHSESAIDDVGHPESEWTLPERPSARPPISQSTTVPSVRANSRMVEQQDVERPETEWTLPEHPSDRFMLESKLARIKRDLGSVAQTLQSTTDTFAIEYINEQGPYIQRMIDDILQSLQEDRSGSAEASVGDDQFPRRQHPIINGRGD